MFELIILFFVVLLFKIAFLQRYKIIINDKLQTTNYLHQDLIAKCIARMLFLDVSLLLQPMKQAKALSHTDCERISPSQNCS